jgi:hypothetical protein
MLNLLVNREVNEPEEWWQKEAKPKEKNKPLKITLVVQVRIDDTCNVPHTKLFFFSIMKKRMKAVEKN